RLLRQPVVANRSRGLERRVDIARFDIVPALLCMVGPYARKAIRLQLDLDLQMIGLRLRSRRPLLAFHLSEQAEELLHMMADLVRDHIGLREQAGSAPRIAAVKADLQIAK